MPVDRPHLPCYQMAELIESELFLHQGNVSQQGGHMGHTWGDNIDDMGYMSHYTYLI